MRDTGPNLATRQLVIDRAQRRCERCRDWGSQIHHRKPRGMGGTRNPQINAPSNLVFLCFDCHEWIERNRDAARMSGWLVPRNDDPELTPIVTLHADVWTLHRDGTVSDGFLSLSEPPF